MKHNSLISIGDMSKLSGVHIKSLRYYDRIGVLKPAWVDPETKYRFYSYAQLGIVDAIQTCVELDIPLSEFSRYTEDGGNEIHFAALLEHGKAMAEKKIKTIRTRINQTEQFQKEIFRAESLRNKKSETTVFPEIQYYTSPIREDITDSELNNQWEELFAEVSKKSFDLGYTFGLLYIFSRENIKRFSCIEIMPTKIDSNNVYVLPAGQYFSKCISESKIETAPEEFPTLFEQDNDIVVLETELMVGDFSINEPPLLELRCLIPG